MAPPAAARTGALAGARIVLGVSGGIAAYKAILVARLLVQQGAHVQPVLTRGARHFVGAATFEGITGVAAHAEVWEDVDQALHIRLAREADAVVVVPATAHLLARAAGGLADDLLTNILLAATCPVVLCPAMHTEMWAHAATQANAATLRARGLHLLGPAEGELMGGDVGQGRVVEPEVVVATLTDLLAGTPGSLAGHHVVVTAGGTREPLDPVRFLGNRSSGKMGFALAAEAARRGATVDLVAAPTQLATPPGVTRTDITTALQMHAAVLALAPKADVIVKAAAVADFRPRTVAAGKLKKADGTPTVELEANPDILAELGATRDVHGALLVGFAAETDDVEANGAAKLQRKNADLLVLNDVSVADAGFEVDTNRVVILGRDDERTEIALTSKAAIAAGVWDRVERLLHGTR